MSLDTDTLLPRIQAPTLVPRVPNWERWHLTGLHPDGS